MIHKSTGEKRIMVIPHPLFYYPTKELTFRQVYTRWLCNSGYSAEGYSEPCQTTEMESFAEIVNGF